MKIPHPVLKIVFFSLLLLIQSCSVKKAFISSIANALASDEGSVFETEQDVELVGEALPFGLKLLESLSAEAPDNRNLYLALAKGYFLYAYAFVDLEAELAKHENYEKYKGLRERACFLFARAYGFGFKGLSLLEGSFEQAYQKDRKAALNMISERSDVPYLYWTGVALAKWIALSPTDPSVISKLPEVAEMMERALLLHPGFGFGSIHEFFVSYESRGSAMGGDSVKALMHYNKALEFAQGRRASVYLTCAESFAIPNQDKEAFDELIKMILDFPVEKYPSFRLANALAIRKARYLMENREELFLE